MGGIIGVTSRLEVDPSIEPRFDFDFSVLGEETVIVRFTVPEGKVIQVDPPEGFANSSLGFDCFGGTSGSGITLMPTIGVVFEDLVGVKPSFIPDVSLYSSGSLISLRSYANFSGKLHFKSIEMRILIPEPFSNSYDVDFATFALYAYATASVSSGLTDPGPWLTIIDDPAIAAELALERASLKRELKKVTRKIKRARAKKDRKELRKLRREKRKLKIRLRRLG